MPSQKLRKPHNALSVHRFKLITEGVFRYRVVDTWRDHSFVRRFENEIEGYGFISGLNFCSHMDVWQPWETDAERREREDKEKEFHKRRNSPNFVRRGGS